MHGLRNRGEAVQRVAAELARVGLHADAARRFPHPFSGGQRQRIAIARALAMLFISHHIGVVRHLSDRLAVMYVGRIVELGPVGPVGQVAGDPQHPCTQALLASLPKLTLDERRVTVFKPIAGELPSPVAPPAGCHFHPRCPQAEARCAAEVPPLRELGGGRRVACHLAPPARGGADDRTPS